jgi:hypothetical protein
MQITIKSALVYVHPVGDDLVSLLTDLPPQRAGTLKCFLTFECDHGAGASYVEKNLKLIPTVVEV